VSNAYAPGKIPLRGFCTVGISAML